MPFACSAFPTCSPCGPNRACSVPSRTQWSSNLWNGNRPSVRRTMYWTSLEPGSTYRSMLPIWVSREVGASRESYEGLTELNEFFNKQHYPLFPNEQELNQSDQDCRSSECHSSRTAALLTNAMLRGCHRQKRLSHRVDYLAKARKGSSIPATALKDVDAAGAGNISLARHSRSKTVHEYGKSST
jgi:hypothetical protein